MTQYAFYFDSNKCTGCKTCQVACKENYKLPVANLYRRVLNYMGCTWTPDEGVAGYVPGDPFGYFVSVACNHCAEPACVESCPTGAMQKDADTGIVWTDHEVCIGCETCVKACPYSAPSLDVEAGYTIKCDMCRDQVAAGDKPICAKSCTMRALEWGTLEELVSQYGEGDFEVEPLPANTTGASVVMNPHRKAQKTGAGTGVIVNLDEEL